MENFETIKKPEIKLQELLSLVKNIRWENGSQFSYNGTNFLLLILSKEKLAELKDISDAGESAEFYRSTSIDGFDIYMHDTIPKEDRQRILFHEILEANILDQEFEDEDAHRIAKNEEEKIFNMRRSE